TRRIDRRVPASQPLRDLKEELVSNLRERVLDLQARGLDEDQAFKGAVTPMGRRRPQARLPGGDRSRVRRTGCGIMASPIMPSPSFTSSHVLSHAGRYPRTEVSSKG